jgi:hypothetical protein
MRRTPFLPLPPPTARRPSGLRVLAAGVTLDGQTGERFYPQPDECLELFSQLDFFQLYHDEAEDVNLLLYPLPVLLSQPVTEVHHIYFLPSLRYLHLRPALSVWASCEEDEEQHLADMSDVVRSLRALIDKLPSLHLETLVLPSSPSALNLDDEAGRATIEQVVGGCEKHDVEVLWTDGTSGSRFCVNELFWCWAKEKRAREKK